MEIFRGNKRHVGIRIEARIRLCDNKLCYYNALSYNMNFILSLLS